jgi:hypothetical protein
LELDFSLVVLLAAFGGGIFGAAIGGQTAFVFAGFMVLVGVANSFAGGTYDFLGNVAFGPVFGPHTAFAGGAASAAYAARYGSMESGRDIGTPITATGNPMALIVGGVFGMFGYAVVTLLNAVLVGERGLIVTDTVALTVALSGIAARILFGRSGLFGPLTPDARERGRLRPGGAQVWVAHQQQLWTTSVLGLGSGLLSAFVVMTAHDLNPDFVPAATVLMFGASAISLLLLQFGLEGPVTHHMTLPGAVVAAAVVAAGSPGGWVLVAGAVGGVAGGLLGEVAARVFLIHGDTHVDPPAIAIAIVASLALMVQIGFGTV